MKNHMRVQLQALDQLSKPAQVLVGPTGIQALPSPVNSIIISIWSHLGY